MAEPLTIKLKTLTPLWTGGAETGKMGHVYETGIIGSLRWWYETVLRGLGASICDPTSDNAQLRCQFDTDAYQTALNKKVDKDKAIQAGLQTVCPVCCLFGCTGWKRRFELQVETRAQQLLPFWLATLDQKGKFNHWWLSQVFQVDTDSRVYFDDLTFQARFIRGYESYGDVLHALLSVMASYGAIGARGQYGFGLFAFPDAYPIEDSIRILCNQVATPTKPDKLSSTSYALNDFWCLQCRIPDSDSQIRKFQRANTIGDVQAFRQYQNRYLPISFDIRYKLPQSSKSGLRQVYRLAHGKKETRLLFGTVQSEDQKWGSRIFVSHLYKSNDTDNYYQLRVWGFSDATIGREIEASLKTMFSNISVTATSGQAILDMAGRAL